MASKKNLIVADMSVKGGRGQPPVRNSRCFFFFKEKKMQNVLKHKNMYLEGFQVISYFFPINLNLLICIQKNDFKKIPYFLSVSDKNRFLPYGQGGGQKCTDTSATIRLFFYAFPYLFKFINFFFQPYTENTDSCRGFTNC